MVRTLDAKSNARAKLPGRVPAFQLHYSIPSFGANVKRKSKKVSFIKVFYEYVL